MRVNLELNFENIAQLADKATQYGASVGELGTAFKKLQAAVEGNKGKAAEKLKENPDKVYEQLEHLEDGLESMSNLFKEFDSTMTGIMAPESRGSMMKVPTRKLKSWLKGASEQLGILNNIASSVHIEKLPTISVDTSQASEGVDSTTPEIDMALYNEVKNKLERMEDLVESIKSTTSSLQANYEQEFSEKYKKVEEFENTDDDFENKGETCYEKTYRDFNWFQTTAGKFVWGIALVALAAVTIVAGSAALAAGAVTGTVATVVGGLVFIAKGAVMAAASTTILDIAKAVYFKEDVDSAASTGICEGVITGAVSAGVVKGAPVVAGKAAPLVTKGMTQIGNSAPQVANGINHVGTFVGNYGKKGMDLVRKVIPTASSAGVAAIGVDAMGDVAGEGAAAMVLGKDYSFTDSAAKAIGSNTVKRGVKHADEIIDKVIDKRNINQTVKNTGKILGKSSVNIFGEEVNTLIEDVKESADTLIEEGELQFEHNSVFTDEQKIIKQALKAHKKDPGTLIEDKTEKVLDWIGKGLQNRTRARG